MDDTPPASHTPRWYTPWRYPMPRWGKRALALGVVAATLGLVAYGYQRGAAHAQRVIARESEKITFSFTIANPPSWLPKTTVNDIRAQIEKYSNRDDATFRRFQNPLDKDVLKTVAEYYTSPNFEGVNRQAVASNAWIKRIIEVRRVLRNDHTEQWIEIFAEFRRPAAVVAVPFGPDGKRLPVGSATLSPAAVPAMRYYLIDGEHIRLPGEYTTNPFVGSYQTLYAVDQDVPAPGSAWTAPEIEHGLKLAAVLQKQPFAGQIALINLTNFSARAAAATGDPTSAHITLTTTAGTEVRWGRPLGQEGIFEVTAARKLTNLVDVFSQFRRIDAGREWLDIRYEDPKVKALSKPEPAPATQPSRPRRTPRG